MTIYYVCDYCGHVEPADDLDDRPQATARCENCRKPLEVRAHFTNLDSAEGYSEKVVAGEAGYGTKA